MLNGEHFADSSDGKDRKPGIYFSYINLNYGVVGTIIEKVTGQRFYVYMCDNVTVEIKMVTRMML